MNRHHVIIVGGGLIGLSTAYALLRDGHRVTMVEKNELGAGAATGNAGELTPQQVAPLASANSAKDIFRGALTRGSYLSIDPLQLLRLTEFGLKFLRSAGPARAQKGAMALAQFTNGILPALHRMADDGIDISGGGNGFLMTSSESNYLRVAHESYARRAEQGWGTSPGPILNRQQLDEVEQALHPCVTGGFTLPGEFSLDPVTFVESLIHHVTERGAQILTGLTALRVGDGPGASIICATASGTKVAIRGDCLVIAAGAWTTPILKRSRIRSAPVVSGKGYSFTVPVKRLPETLIHSMDLHCVAIPMNGRLRIVGMMEFDGRPEKTNPDRLELLASTASRLVQGADWCARTDEWIGARPMTADGLPLLGFVNEYPNVVVATGHNMHGLSLGPITGEVVADLLGRREAMSNGREIDLAPFSVRR